MYRHDYVISVSPSLFITGEGLSVGKSVTGKNVTIEPDMLSRHLLILGKTGTGKSNLLRLLIKGIIAGDHGSVVVLDPHGDLGKECVSLFPENSFVISPKHVNSESGELFLNFNAISTPGGSADSSLSAGWIRDAFSSEGVFSQGTWGPRLEVVFTAILNEIIETKENANLNDLLNLLLNPGDMRRFVSSTSNDQLKAFLKMQISDWRGWNQYVTSSINKLMPLVVNKGISRLISGRVDSLNLYDYMQEKPRILVPEIWKEVVPQETYKILAILILLKIWALRLSENNSSVTRPIYVVVDEAQLIPENILDRLLREGRKFGFRLIIATQFLDRSQVKLGDTIRGNIGNFIGFSVSQREAEQISENFFSGYLKDKLSDVLKSQSIHKAVIWSQHENGYSGPLSFEPCRQEAVPDNQLFVKIRNKCIIEHGLPENDVPKAESTADLHEFLILQFQKYLEKHSIASDRGLEVSGSYPDAVFEYLGNRFLVEVEVSDLTNFSRIISKMEKYAGMWIIFLTPPENSRKLMARILQYLAENPRKIFDNPGSKVTDPLSRVTILEYSRGFQFLAAGRLRRFRFEFLTNGTFIKTMEELSYPQIRKFLYSRMIKDATFRIDYPRSEISKTFGDKNSINAERYLADKDGITQITHLFFGAGK